MNEKKPFEGENPFRKLDKKRFLSHDEKKKAKSLKKNGLISNNDGEVSSFYAEFVSPQDEGETRAFLNAVSGVPKTDEALAVTGGDSLETTHGLEERTARHGHIPANAIRAEHIG